MSTRSPVCFLIPLSPSSMLSPRRFSALSLFALAACSGAEVNAPASISGARVLATLQLESTADLPTSLNDRLSKASVAWSPPIGGEYARLFVPAEVIEVADTVRAGVAVPIVVNSIGENGCWQAYGGTLSQRGDSALVWAYDRHSGAAACTQLWTDRLRHEFTTTFPRAGTGIIRAYGRRARVADATYNAPVVAERAVVVIP